MNQPSNDSTSSQQCEASPEQKSQSLNRRDFVQTSAAFGSLAGLSGLVEWSNDTNSLQDAPLKVPPAAFSLASGIVFHDRNGSGQPGGENVGIAAVAVSNGQQVVLTDAAGKWELPIDDQVDSIFVIKPRNWMVRTNDQNLPQTTCLHSPTGSPKLRFGGLKATGELAASINFGLVEHAEPDQFQTIVCGDPQPRDVREIDYIASSVVPAMIGTDAAFGVSLGDIMFDNLSLYGPLNQAMGLIGIPWFNVLGNHDLDFDAVDSRHAYDTFKQNFGASYFAFDWGPVHFLVLNNVQWSGANPDQLGSRGSYFGGFGTRQLEFIKNDLAHVPQDKLVVMLMHIPLVTGLHSNPALETGDRDQLFEILAGRTNLLSFSAHLHWHANLFLGPDQGWHGEVPFHHIVTGTLCGSWFGGAPDVKGIPHATMSDGNPRGYVEVAFDGNRYNIDGYRAIGFTKEYQIQIHAPAEVAQSALPQHPIFANVFNGCADSQVKLRIGTESDWHPMEPAWQTNPAYEMLFQRDAKLELPYRGLPKPVTCQHLWTFTLAADTPPGTYLIDIESTDRYGNTHRGVTPMRIV